MTQSQIEKLLATPILYASAVAAAETSVQLSNSSARATAEAALAEVKARWESEAPARAVRAAADKAGFRKFDGFDGPWSRKENGRWKNYNNAGVAAFLAGAGK